MLRESIFMLRVWTLRDVVRCASAALAVVGCAAGAMADARLYSNVGAHSKWDARVHGSPATVTWSFVDDGVLVHGGHPDAAQFDPQSEGSKIGALRTSFDEAYGAGAFDTAIQNAFDTWQGIAEIDFVYVANDSGLPLGHPEPPQVDIRIAAYAPAAGTLFASAGAFGYGPPGDDEFFPDSYPVAGDIVLNINQPFLRKPGAEGDAVDPYGNDLEGLVLHELGHAVIGLDHPESGPGDVMYIGAGCCDFINRYPSQDEVAAARWVYGPSDFNGDSAVNAADYTVWRDRKAAVLASLDPNDPGYIAYVTSNYDQLYQNWVGEYGLALGGAAPSSSAPEPVAAALLASACVAHAFRRRPPRMSVAEWRRSSRPAAMLTR